MSAKKKAGRLARRDLLAGAAAAAAVSIVRPSSVRGSGANSAVEIALLGCGGRGSWLGGLFAKHGGYKWVACADYYQDHADSFGEAWKIPADKRFTALSGYKKMLDVKCDAVIVQTPPYFHPIHAAAAVDAGKHVYVAKPIAVDAPGCLSIGDSGKRATEKKLVFLVDFQTRANEYYREAVKRVHRGDIGKLVTGWAMYPWGVGHFPGPGTPDDRLRRWYCIRELSGDFIVEQNVHTLDVATWILNADPIKAMGVGGSRGLRAYGNIMDYFNIHFWFPNDFVLSFVGNQCTPGAPTEIPCRVYGSKGTIDTDYYTHVNIDGMPECVYKGSKWEHGALYTTGAEVNIKEFHEAITKGEVSNPTVAPSVRSNLTAVLGRIAGYKGGMVTWDEMIKANERLEPDLKGLKA
ncbi:MAG TPA: Gfo/Idh/MocA family oxidoreductase [Phycisphaerae bacterium]|nr:Gfo/Idh/MocA family oxidoreductase [Phycisphaerae bacterium]HRY69415.1 Gfo/Idh/MocA family oxidoreductase [Phycisphaerae bacterium]HSA26282.1 Gfo/Idh/MocA family oxidoreductase [Phycisphaerae bacterium]